VARYDSRVDLWQQLRGTECTLENHDVTELGGNALVVAVVGSCDNPMLIYDPVADSWREEKAWSTSGMGFINNFTHT
jgi:hypothetical protein